MMNFNTHNLESRVLSLPGSLVLVTKNMAEIVLVRQQLQLIGFTANGAEAVVDQGFSAWAELAFLTDDEVEGLCKSIRRPGGMIPGPVAVAGGVAGPAVANPGTTVSQLAENNLKLLCYYLRFLQRISLQVVVAQLTLANIRAMRDQKDQETVHKEPDAPDLDDKDWPRTMEALHEYFSACLGTTKIPLAYVLRKSFEPLPAPATGWPSNEICMISRAPIVVDANANPLVYTNHFTSDNKTVWIKIAAMTRDKECWTYVRTFQRKQDGRGAYWALYDHYLGAHNVDHMSARAEHKLQNTVYNGEKRRWNFESYVRVHVNQHAILEGLTEFGYSGIDERSKVRYLIGGIKTTTLDTVKANVMASALLRSDFHATAGLYKDFIDQMKTSHSDKEVTIAAVTGETSKNQYNKVKPDMSVEDRYYNKKEYMALTPEQKAGLKAKRVTREGGKPKSNSNKRKANKGPKKQMTLSKASIKAVVTALKEADDEASASSSDDDESVAMKPPADKKQKIVKNRNNPALKRKGE